MRLVRGETLKERIRKFHNAGSIGRQPVAFRQLLNHFVRICDIVAYAHSRGVLHRDLKPSNVMLGKFGETLVVDWGLAKPIEPSAESRPAVLDELTLRPISGSSVQATLHGATLGTPQYMSPEQALGQLDRVGRVSDVYSLGATLYCILTGSPPLARHQRCWRGARPRGAWRYCPAAEPQIRRAADARGDLPQGDGGAAGGSISVGAGPGGRHRELAGRRACSGSARAAGPPACDLGAKAPHVSSRQRPRFDGRGAGCRAGGALASTPPASEPKSGGSRPIELSRIAEARKQEADRQRDALRRLTTRLTLDRGLGLLEGNNRRAGLLWLARSLESAAGQNDPFEPAIRGNLAAWSPLVHRLRDCLEHEAPVRVVAWSPTGRAIATGSDDGIVRLWDPTGSSESPSRQTLKHAGAVRALAFTRDGKTLATGCDDQTARLWNAASGLPRGEPMHHRGPVVSVAFSPDDSTLVTGKRRRSGAALGRGDRLSARQTARARQAAQDRLDRTRWKVDRQHGRDGWRRSSGIRQTGQDTIQADTIAPRGVEVLAFSPDSTKLACGGREGQLFLLNAADGSEIARASKGTQGERSLPLHSATTAARSRSAATTPRARIWRAADLVALSPKMEHRGHVWAIAFSPDDSLLAAAADDNTAQLWNTLTFERAGDSLPHQKPVRAVAFSPDGRMLCSGCEDSIARVWQLGGRQRDRPAHAALGEACAASRPGPTARPSPR